MCLRQVLMAGGVSEYCASAMTPAGDTSFLIDVTPGANHSIVEEMLDYPRVVRFCSRQLSEQIVLASKEV